MNKKIRLLIVFFWIPSVIGIQGREQIHRRRVHNNEREEMESQSTDSSLVFPEDEGIFGKAKNTFSGEMCKKRRQIRARIENLHGELATDLKRKVREAGFTRRKHRAKLVKHLMGLVDSSSNISAFLEAKIDEGYDVEGAIQKIKREYGKKFDKSLGPFANALIESQNAVLGNEPQEEAIRNVKLEKKNACLKGFCTCLDAVATFFYATIVNPVSCLFGKLLGRQVDWAPRYCHPFTDLYIGDLGTVKTIGLFAILGVFIWKTLGVLAPGVAKSIVSAAKVALPSAVVALPPLLFSFGAGYTAYWIAYTAGLPRDFCYLLAFLVGVLFLFLGKYICDRFVQMYHTQKKDIKGEYDKESEEKEEKKRKCTNTIYICACVGLTFLFLYKFVPTSQSFLEQATHPNP